MRTRVLILSVLGLCAACSGQSTRAYSPACGVGVRWDESENGWNGTWTRRGTSNTFDAVWSNGGASGSSVLTLTLTGNRVHIERRDAASFGGASVSYDGTIAADGTVSGTSRVASSGAAAAFRAVVTCGDTAATPVPPPQNTSLGCGLGAHWDETENGWKGTWTRRGSSGIFDAVWRNGGTTGSSVLTMTLSGNRVHIDRADAASFGGASVSYDGTISADGKVNGTARPSSTSQSYNFQASIVCGGTGSTTATPTPITGVQYRMENLIYGEPDVYTNPRNYHDFMVDFATCTLHELNEENAQGREQIQVAVCRPKRRLTFTTTVDGGNPVQYDWAFHNDGRIAAGVWRQGAGNGPSVGGLVGADSAWDVR